MKKTLLLMAVSAALVPAFAETIIEKSPDGLNEIRLITEPSLQYAVYRDGVELIAPTTISMTFKEKGTIGGKNLLKKPKVLANEHGSRNAVLETPCYKKAKVDDNGNETTVTFEGGWQVVLHARNDGVAYRFKTAWADPVVTVTEDEAPLTFPKPDLTAYVGWTRGGGHYCSWESIYEKTTTGKLKEKSGVVYLPLLVEYPKVGEKEGVSLVVTESDLLDYAGWNLVPNGEAPAALKSSLARLPDPQKIKDTRRSRQVNGRLDYIAATQGTRAYPWRVFILAPNTAKLVESDIVYALATPSKLDGHPSWVKPGKVAWDWWNDWNVTGVPFKSGCNTKTYEYYIDFASKNNIEYVIFDEGWSEKLQVMKIHKNVDVPALVSYAKSRGVGIILWCSWPQLVSNPDEVFQRYAAMGVKGFKIDFMDRDDQFVVSYLARTAEIAAKYKLMVDYHGMYKPTGLSRTYPNIVNYEGVHGLENLKWEPDSDFPANDLKVLFTRMVAGPLDYTPGAMRNMTRAAFRPSNSLPGSQGTRVHQMALMSLFEAPLQMLCDTPSQYLKNQECFDFMAKVPTVWDETIGLAADVDKFAAIARRKGDVWYVSAIGAWQPQELVITLDFLAQGEWVAEIFEDGVNANRDATDYIHREEKVQTGSKFAVKLGPGGGFTARISRDTWTNKIPSKLQFWK